MKILKMDYKDYIKQMDEKDVVLVDPPWSYDDKHPRAVKQLSYSLWDNDVTFIFENVKTKYLLIWVTNSFVDKLFQDYFSSDSPFEYKTLITWVKLTKSGKLFYGLGNHFRNATEHIAVFVRKDIKPIRLAIRNVFHAKVGPRTLKPKEFEVKILKEFNQAGFSKFAYIFSGPYINAFKKLDIDLVDICFETTSQRS